MSSRYRIELAGAAALVLLAGCGHGKPMPSEPLEQPDIPGVVASALTPGVDHALYTTDPRARQYYDNADAVTAGRRLFQAYNCNGCHSNGGGGMGPALMDGKWIYGARLEQIHQTLVEGRPNGMPSWGGKIPDPELWQLAAYVRSMSLPQTLAHQSGPTPSQLPAPVPSSVDVDPGWSAPPDTTNDYADHLQGPAP